MASQPPGVTPCVVVTRVESEVRDSYNQNYLWNPFSHLESPVHYIYIMMETDIGSLTKSNTANSFCSTEQMAVLVVEHHVKYSVCVERPECMQKCTPPNRRPSLSW